MAEIVRKPIGLNGEWKLIEDHRTPFRIGFKFYWGDDGYTTDVTCYING